MVARKYRFGTYGPFICLCVDLALSERVAGRRGREIDDGLRYAARTVATAFLMDRSGYSFPSGGFYNGLDSASIASQYGDSLCDSAGRDRLLACWKGVDAMTCGRKSLWKHTSGNVFLEHAFLTLPLLLIGVVLLANAALFFHAYQVVSAASASGARAAARVEDRNVVIQAVQKELHAGGLPIGSPAFNPSSDLKVSFQDGVYCTVKVTYHYRFPFSFSKVGLHVNETLHFASSASFMREWGS